jgi:hypothetical protein
MGMSPRLLRPRATGFTPNNISGLEAWWDFSDTSRITLNSGDFVSGGNVSQILNKGLLTRTLTQPSASAQPAYVPNARAGKGAIYFDASKTVSNAVISLTQPTTWFFTFQAPTTGAGSWAFFDGLTSRQHVYGNVPTEMRMFAGASPVIATLVASAWYVGVLVYNGTSSTYRISTTAATTTNPGTNSIIAPVIGTATGTRGYVGEFGIYSKALSDAEAVKLARYLGSRWSITLA